MSDLANLRASCHAVLTRHQHSAYDIPCVVCGQRVRGAESCMAHYATAHHIRPVHFDDVADLDGLLACLRALLFPPDGRLCCPVCGAACGDVSALAAHSDSAAHGAWNADTIPPLAPFCIPPPADASGSERSDGAGSEAESAHSDGGAVCLLCAASAADPVAHMRSAHAVDVRRCVREHGAVRDVYDAIRAVNAVRRCVARGECPKHGGNAAADPTEWEACRRDVAERSLEAHLRSHPSHTLPRIIPSGDAALIPFLPGDAFISDVILAGGLMLEEDEEDPDYPMVPTIAEMARRQHSIGKGKGG